MEVYDSELNNSELEKIKKNIESLKESKQELSRGMKYDQEASTIMFQFLADITNKNANVYLEVGYAMGLAKSKGIENQIMFFVKTDEDGDVNVGFDLQSYQQNRYKNTEELRTQLEAQLKVYYSKLIGVR